MQSGGCWTKVHGWPYIETLSGWEGLLTKHKTSTSPTNSSVHAYMYVHTDTCVHLLVCSREESLKLVGRTELSYYIYDTDGLTRLATRLHFHALETTKWIPPTSFSDSSLRNGHKMTQLKWTRNWQMTSLCGVHTCWSTLVHWANSEKIHSGVVDCTELGITVTECHSIVYYLLHLLTISPCISLRSGLR